MRWIMVWVWSGLAIIEVDGMVAVSCFVGFEV